MGASARGVAATLQARRLPSLIPSHVNYSREIPGEIVGAHEERVIEQHLSIWRLITGVVQSHQTVPQERDELAASHRQFAGRSRRLDYLSQVRLNFYLGVGVFVQTVSPFGS